jgi:hypothetical protein
VDSVVRRPFSGTSCDTLAPEVPSGRQYATMLRLWSFPVYMEICLPPSEAAGASRALEESNQRDVCGVRSQIACNVLPDRRSNSCGIWQELTEMRLRHSGCFRCLPSGNCMS